MGKDSGSGTGPTGPTGRWPDVPQLPLSAAQVFADDLVEQYLVLGIARPEAQRLLQLGCAALNAALAKIDSHAFTSAPIADQVSMLLPRLDIDTLSELMGMALAQVQSAMAMLALEYVTLRRPA